ncbi:MAG: DUF4136 domain-containing protein [Tepidisphaeraceae bacterium]
MTAFRLWRVPIAVIMSVAACGCSSAPTVSTSSDPDAPLTSYHTFKLAGGRIVTQPDIVVQDPKAVEQRISSAIEQQLESKGLHAVQSDPQLIVKYLAGAHSIPQTVGSQPLPEQEYGATQGFDEPCEVRSDRGWDTTSGRWAGHEQTQGTLVIDLFDAKTKRLVWRATCQVDAQHPGSQQVVQRAVREAFSKFPHDR